MLEGSSMWCLREGQRLGGGEREEVREQNGCVLKLTQEMATRDMPWHFKVFITVQTKIACQT